MNTDWEKVRELAEELGLTPGEVAEAVRRYKQQAEERHEVPEGQLAFAGVV